jgi:2-methylcitrate dehydratase PrpD
MEAGTVGRQRFAAGVTSAAHADARSGCVAERLAAFVHETTLDKVPAAVVERAKYILLDTIGIMLAAADAPEMAAFRASLADSVAGNATVFGEVHKTSALVAAIVNGSLTTVLQFDEGHRESMGHPAIHIVPAVLAVAEELQCTGEECLGALIVGYEAAVRIGRSVFPLRPQLHPHGNWPTIGAALAVGKLLRLKTAELARLIDCAAMMSLFSWRRATVGGATIHHVLPGLAAHNAIVAAYAARAGLSAPQSSLDEFLLPLASEGPSPALLDADLGARWEILENYFKPYPACAHAHSAIAATRNLLDRHRIDASEIEQIRVATYPLAATLNDQAPRNQLAGMFSIPYVIGLLIARGGFDLEALMRQAPLSGEALEIAKRVQVRADAALTPPYPLGRPSRVQVCLNDGTVLDEFVAAPPSLAAPDALYPALCDKFVDLARRTTFRDRAAALLDNLLRIERLPSVRLLFH